MIFYWCKKSEELFFKPWINIKLNKVVSINTSNIKLRNVILNRDTIIWDFNDWYYTENKSIILISNDEFIVDENSISWIEFMLSNNYFLNRGSDIKEVESGELLVYRWQKKAWDIILYTNIIYILWVDSILEILVVWNNLEFVDNDTDKLLSSVEL